MRSPWCWPLRPRGSHPRSCSESSLRPCRPPRRPSRSRRSSAACTQPRAHCTETERHFIKHLAGATYRSAHAHSQNQKPRKQSSRRRPHSQILRDTPGERPLSPDAGAHDGDRPGGGRAAVVRARHGEHGAEATAGLAGARGCGAIRMG
jgi:hypothetical protein